MSATLNSSLCSGVYTCNSQYMCDCVAFYKLASLASALDCTLSTSRVYTINSSSEICTNCTISNHLQHQVLTAAGVDPLFSSDAVLVHRPNVAQSTLCSQSAGQTL